MGADKQNGRSNQIARTRLAKGIRLTIEGQAPKYGYFLYEDYRADSPHRPPFYVGVGTWARIMQPLRNEYHQRVAERHGVLRRVELVADSEEAFQMEVARIKDLREQGVALANLTPGGDGCVITRNVETGEVRVFSPQQVPAGFVPYMTGWAWYRHCQNGLIWRFQRGKAPSGWVSITEGRMPARHVATGEIATRPVVAPGNDDWEHVTAGSATVRHVESGHTCSIQVDLIGTDGWVGVRRGTVVCQSPDGICRSFPQGQLPEGWRPVNAGKAPYVCRDQRVRIVDVSDVPEGARGVRAGYVSAVGPTGETGSFAVGTLPEGWRGVRAGHTPARCVATGETRSFPCGEVPEGWRAPMSKRSVYRSRMTGETASFEPGTQPAEYLAILRWNTVMLAPWRRHLADLYAKYSLPPVKILPRTSIRNLIDHESTLMARIRKLGARERCYGELIAEGEANAIPGVPSDYAEKRKPGQR